MVTDSVDEHESFLQLLDEQYCMASQSGPDTPKGDRFVFDYGSE